MTAMRLLQQEFATGEMGFTMSICAAAIRQAECLKGVIRVDSGVPVDVRLVGGSSDKRRAIRRIPISLSSSRSSSSHRAIDTNFAVRTHTPTLPCRSGAREKNGENQSGRIIS